jgi:hypothetical protein
VTHKAVLLFHEKVEYADGDIVEVKAWAVTPSPAKPEGIKYSLVYIGKDGTRILGYDNAEGKGHHKHLGGWESPSEFTSIERLIERFGREVAQLRRRMT